MHLHKLAVIPQTPTNCGVLAPPTHTTPMSLVHRHSYHAKSVGEHHAHLLIKTPRHVKRPQKGNIKTPHSIHTIKLDLTLGPGKTFNKSTRFH